MTLVLLIYAAHTVDDVDTAMGHSAQVQPWKMNSCVTDYMTVCAEAGIHTQPSKTTGGRANFYPKGAMMFNGGQGTGDGGNQVIYDTDKGTKAAQVLQSELAMLTS